jgi:DNA-binding NarL/FixJ family response regulator
MRMKMLTATVLTTDKFFQDAASYFLAQRGYDVLPAPATGTSPLLADLYVAHSGADANGLVQQALSAAPPTARLVVYNAACSPADFPRLARQGATAGCLTAADGLPELLACLDGQPRGEQYVSPGAAQLLQAPVPAGRPAPCPLTKLSAQERNVFTLIGQGLGSKQIAETLFVSSHTIKNHKTNISRKLEVGSCRELLSIALSAASQASRLVTYSY